MFLQGSQRRKRCLPTTICRDAKTANARFDKLPLVCILHLLEMLRGSQAFFNDVISLSKAWYLNRRALSEVFCLQVRIDRVHLIDLQKINPKNLTVLGWSRWKDRPGKEQKAVQAMSQMTSLRVLRLDESIARYFFNRPMPQLLSLELKRDPVKRKFYLASLGSS